MRRWLVLGAFGAGLVVVAGCSDAGTPFDVGGRVTRVGENSISVDTLEVFDGLDGNRFEVGSHHRVHDNADNKGWSSSRRYYGTVYGLDGAVVDTLDVELGSCVRLTGHIREHHEGKYVKDRPVFDEARVVGCELLGGD